MEGLSAPPFLQNSLGFIGLCQPGIYFQCCILAGSTLAEGSVAMTSGRVLFRTYC